MLLILHLHIWHKGGIFNFYGLLLFSQELYVPVTFPVISSRIYSHAPNHYELFLRGQKYRKLKNEQRKAILRKSLSFIPWWDISTE